MDGAIAESGAQAARLWAIRERLTESEAREGPSLKHDVSVPLTEMAAFLAEIDAALAKLAPGARLNVFGHLGDGNLHVNVLIGPEHDRKGISRVVHDLTTRRGGSISAEHGLGQYRAAEWRRLQSPASLKMAARLKNAMDPELRLNPGKVVDPELMALLRDDAPRSSS